MQVVYALPSGVQRITTPFAPDLVVRYPGCWFPEQSITFTQKLMAPPVVPQLPTAIHAPVCIPRLIHWLSTLFMLTAELELTCNYASLITIENIPGGLLVVLRVYLLLTCLESV